VLVLDAGQRQELGEVWRVFGDPQAEATRALLRPLQHGLPADLAQALVPALQGRLGRAIYSAGFTGNTHAQGLPLAALAALGPGAELLHGGLDRIRGHAHGRLLLSLPADTAPSEDRLRQILGADHLDLLGHVPAPA
jgi:D-methionine transport system ATP-binding protein